MIGQGTQSTPSTGLSLYPRRCTRGGRVELGGRGKTVSNCFLLLAWTPLVMGMQRARVNIRGASRNKVIASPFGRPPRHPTFTHTPLYPTSTTTTTTGREAAEGRAVVYARLSIAQGGRTQDHGAPTAPHQVQGQGQRQHQRPNSNQTAPQALFRSLGEGLRRPCVLSLGGLA